MGNPARMTGKEARVLNLLATAWDEFTELPRMHPNDQQEVCRLITAAQSILLSRVGLRSLYGEKGMMGDAGHPKVCD
jgi:hypothetical protein